MTKLDLTKPVQTRDGRPVKIDRTDLKNDRPVSGTVTNENGVEFVAQWLSSGRRYASCESALDLINVPPKPVKYYVNVYRSTNGITIGSPNPNKPINTTANDFIKTIEFEVP